MMFRRTIGGVIAILASASPLVAQETRDEAGELRVFLDCEECDFNYVRTEIPWVAFMRDRADAEVHILVTEIGTGAGGRQYTTNLLGRGRFAGRSDTLRFVSEPGQPSDVVRSGLTRTIQLGLMPYVLQTPQASRLRISFRGLESEEERESAAGTDPWNAWVFRVQGDGQLDKEQSQSDLQLEGSFSANRVTDRWKIGISADGDFNRDHLVFTDDDGERIRRTTKRENYSSGVVLIKSLGPHWGVGVEAAASSSTFQNTKLALRTAPAIEYSVWPYAEATRRQLTFQYSAGVSSYDYRELTIFDRLSETRPTQSFIVGYDVRQPWGEADVTLETAGFLDDLEQFRVEFDGGIDIQLFRGFSLNLGAGASLIRDQLSIVKEPDPNDVLQDLRELLTDYRYDFSVGFSYSFGSIFNSVVNPRFGGGTGEILR
jgi:hypothetical protein